MWSDQHAFLAYNKGSFNNSYYFPRSYGLGVNKKIQNVCSSERLETGIYRNWEGVGKEFIGIKNWDKCHRTGRNMVKKKQVTKEVWGLGERINQRVLWF